MDHKKIFVLSQNTKKIAKSKTLKIYLLSILRQIWQKDKSLCMLFILSLKSQKNCKTQKYQKTILTYEYLSICDIDLTLVNSIT